MLRNCRGCPVPSTPATAFLFNRSLICAVVICTGQVVTGCKYAGSRAREGVMPSLVADVAQ